MKKSIFLSFILCLCLVACIPQQAMAQKQSRMEKLLRYLNDNDADKWQKNREKLDDETKAYYAEELSLMDVLNDLWNKQSEQAATLYFGCYEKAAQSYFPGICEGEKIQLSNIREKADQSIISLLEASKDKIPFSRALLDSIHATEYPADSSMLQRLQNLREVALLEGMLKTPSPAIYRTYVKEYPDGKFIAQVNASENVRLYQLVKAAPTPANFKAFFEDPEMQKYYQTRGPRPYLAEVRTLYDDFLFQRIDSLKKEGNATAIRQIIDDYKNTPYLATGTRTHLNDLEYLSEKADFELLKPAIVNSESLGLLQEFLKTHKYKEFRDQANALRAPFVLQAIVSTPTAVKYYTQGRLTKCCETDSTGNITTSYIYNDKGQLTTVLSVTEKNGQPANEVQTSRLYDPQGHCIFEVKTNPKTKTDFYRRTRRIGIDGSIESDSLKYMDGRYTVSSYNKQGLLTECKEYNKNGELEGYTVNKYDDNGKMTESQHQNILFVNSPNQGQLTTVLSVTEKNGQPANEVQTSRLYDPQGHCIFEVKTNPKTKTDFYRRTRRIGIDGSIESDSLKYMDGRYTVSSYNKQGLLTECKEYNKNGELEGYTVNKYDDNGKMTESQHQNILFVNSPNQLLSQKELYEYDKYGYLTRIVYQRIFGNSQKTSGCLTCLYDEYGNRIDGDSYYEYDNTGQWVCRTNHDNPQQVERIQYIYK